MVDEHVETIMDGILDAKELLDILGSDKLETSYYRNQRLCDLVLHSATRLGEGSYGVVIKGCFSELCSFPVAIKIVYFSLGHKIVDNEIKALIYLRSQLLDKYLYPGVTIIGDGKVCSVSASSFIKSFLPTNREELEDSCLLIVTELLEEVPRVIPPAQFYDMCLQYLCAVMALTEAASNIIHYDLTISNTLLRRVYHNRNFEFRVRGYGYSIPNPGYQIVISDFGSSDAPRSKKSDIFYEKPIYNQNELSKTSEIYKKNVNFLRHANILSVFLILYKYFWTPVSNDPRMMVFKHFFEIISKLPFETIRIYEATKLDLNSILELKYLSYFDMRYFPRVILYSHKLKFNISNIISWENSIISEEEKNHSEYITRDILRYQGNPQSTNEIGIANIIDTINSIPELKIPLTVYSVNRFFSGRDIITTLKVGDIFYYPRIMSTTTNIDVLIEGFIYFSTNKTEKDHLAVTIIMRGSLEETAYDIRRSRLALNTVISKTIDNPEPIAWRSIINLKDINESERLLLSTEGIVPRNKLKNVIANIKKIEQKEIENYKEYTKMLNKQETIGACCIFVISNVKKCFSYRGIIPDNFKEEEIILAPQTFKIIDKGEVYIKSLVDTKITSLYLMPYER